MSKSNYQKSKSGKPRSNNRNNRSPYTKGNENPKDQRDYRKTKEEVRRPKRDLANVELGVDDPSTYVNKHVETADNDVSWYMVNRKLVTDSTQIPTGNMVGDPIRLGGSNSNEFTLPGIMAFHTLITPGYSIDGTSAPSRIALALTEYLRSQLTNDQTIDSPDVFQYMYAMDNLFALSSYITRIFGIANYFQFNNLYTPSVVLNAACGFLDEDTKDLVDHRADYIARYNWIVGMATQLYIPVSYTAMLRHSWLFSNYWYDSKDPKAQMYIHRPTGFYVFDDTISNQGTCCHYVSVSDTMDADKYENDPYQTYYFPLGANRYPGNRRIPGMERLLNFMEKMIIALMNSDTMRRIREIMIKAYKGVSPWRMGLLDVNYTVAPTHSDEVLSQINNTRIMTNFYLTSGGVHDVHHVTNHVMPDGTKITGDVIIPRWDVTQVVDGLYIKCEPGIFYGNTQSLDAYSRAFLIPS